MNALVTSDPVTTVERIKLQLMDGIDVAIKNAHRNYRQAALTLNIDPEHMYRLRTRDTSLFSVVWLINTADRLGASVSVCIAPPSCISSLPSETNHPISAINGAGASRS